MRLKKKHVSMAGSEEDLPPAAVVPINHEASLREAKRVIGSYGYLIRRRRGISKHAQRFTMTLRHNVWLSTRWPEMSTGVQSQILWHEIVHIRQRARMGHSKFEMCYLTSRGRWLLEVPAYRMSIRASERMTNGLFDTEEYIHRTIYKFRSAYLLKTINRADFFYHTRDILNREASR